MASKSKNLHQTGDSTNTERTLDFLAQRIALVQQPQNHLEILLQGIPGKMRLPEHWNVRLGPQKEDLLYFVTEGRFFAQIHQQDFTVSVGDILWVPAGTAFHLWLAPSETCQIWRFRWRMRPRPPKPPLSPHYLHLPGAWPCQIWMEKLTSTAAAYRKPHQAGLQGLFLCLLTEMADLLSHPQQVSRVLNPTQQQHLIDYFSAHVRSRPQPADLAAQLQLSPDYFTRIFRQTFGVSPRRWLMQQRIQLAALRLLESNLNVSEVAHEFGYQDVFLFSRQFKAVLGYSPLIYRQQSK